MSDAACGETDAEADGRREPDWRAEARRRDAALDAALDMAIGTARGDLRPDPNPKGTSHAGPKAMRDAAAARGEAGAGGFSALEAGAEKARPLEESLGLAPERSLGAVGAGARACGRVGAAAGRMVFGPGGAAGAWARLGLRLRRFGAARSGAALLIAGAALGAGLAALPPVQEAVRSGFERMRAEALARPEFAITQLEIDGATRLSDAALVLALAPPGAERAALAYDFQAARARLEALGWVERASIVLKPPHTLAVEIVERRPAALWRRGGRLMVIDAAGHVAEEVRSRGAHPALPLLVGPGAETEAREALRLHAAASQGGLKVAALTRIGERRWDLELLGGPRIMLPEADPEAALERAVSWAQTADLLERGYEMVDLRLPFAPTVRLGPDAAERETAPVPASFAPALAASPTAARTASRTASSASPGYGSPDGAAYGAAYGSPRAAAAAAEAGL